MSRFAASLSPLRGCHDICLSLMRFNIGGHSMHLELELEGPALHRQVFSHFRHRDTCTGAEVLTPMEPLVGTLRHPAVNSECGR